MKKSLIALAALAATASFAQSSVTLSGNLDFAAGSVKSGTQAAETTIANSTIVSSTSLINIIAVEDLGGGMKATVKYGFDPRNLANDSAAGSTAAPGLQRDELFVGIEGGFGNLRLGSPNSIGLTTFLSASPLGTGIGSGFGVTVADYSTIRYSRSARYDSPSFNGFTVSVLHAPGADTAVAAVSGSVPTIPAATAATEIGLAYANGPLTVGYANIGQAKYGTKAKTSTNVLAASYKLGNTTLSAGWNDGDIYPDAARAATATKTEGYRVGLRQDIGAIALIASYAQQKASNVTEKVTGLRADYNLSKTAAVYLGYEDYDTGVAATSAATGNRKTTSVGVRKAF